MSERFELTVLALVILCFMGAAVYLIIHDHPWFGLLLLLMAGTAKYSSGDKGSPQEPESDGQ